MSTLNLLYNLALTLFLAFSGWNAASSKNDLLLAALFFPLPIYFFAKLVQQTARAGARKAASARTYNSTLTTDLAHSPSLQPKSDDNAILEGEVLEGKNVKDFDKRIFLKLIGSSGLTLFMLSIFTDKAHAAFFGSVPGPGTVALKDSSGNQIDPAERQPTDGYEIAQIDDTTSSDYAWYGFVDKNGAWYIMREDLAGGDAGTYLYAAGASSFSTNWTNRAILSYTTFDSAF